jgi:hypothetical protein
MLMKMYTQSNQLIIKQLKEVLHIIKIMGSIITYKEVTFFQYHLILFGTI